MAFIKKSILYLFLFILFPISVNANIICNDGTVSDTCYDCHRGCCSKHGGCSANSPTTDDYVYIPSTTTMTTTTKKIATTSSTTTTTTELTTTTSQTTTSSTSTTSRTTGSTTVPITINDSNSENGSSADGFLGIVFFLSLIGCGVFWFKNKDKVSVNEVNKSNDNNSSFPKVGLRKFSPLKSLKARTTGKINKTVKKSIIPLYGRKGLGFIKSPKKSIKNKIYHKTTFGFKDIFK